jgi:hypothetical protein
MAMKRWVMAGLCAALAALPARAKVLYSETFDNGTGGWANGDQDGEAPTTSNAEAHAGAALVSHYQVGTGVPPHLLVLPSPPSLTGARAVRLWVRTAEPTLLAVFLAQQNGARYISVTATAARTWQHFEISIDRFRLSEDTADPAGHLDLSTIAALAIVDMSGVFPGARRAARQTTLWLDDIQIDDEEAPTAYSANHKLPFVLDSFDTDLVSWIPVAGSVVHDTKAGEMLWRYPPEKPENSFAAMICFVGTLPAQGARHLVLTLRSARQRHLAIILQEVKHGGQPERWYLHPTDVPAGGKAVTLTLALSDFQLDHNKNPNDNKPLELQYVGNVIVGDIDVMSGTADGDNTLALSELLLSAD